MKQKQKAKESETANVCDLFDMTEREFERIAALAYELRKKHENLTSVAKDLGIVGGGPLALKAYLFGRIVQANESGDKNPLTPSSAGDDEEITPDEMVQLLDLMKKVVRAKQKGEGVGLPNFDELRAKKRKNGDGDFSYIG